MSKFNPPKELSFEGNLSENWERWKKEFKCYLTATESDEKGDDGQDITAFDNNRRESTRRLLYVYIRYGRRRYKVRPL